MDFHFVDNLSFGFQILNNICQHFPNFKIDCHFMVKIKEEISLKDYLQRFINNNVKMISIHFESLSKKQIIEFLNLKKIFKDLQIGFALRPQTKIEVLYPFLDKIDYVLIMSVNPGFGGQKFIQNTKLKILLLRKYLLKYNLNCFIEVDGGINEQTILNCKDIQFAVIGSFLSKQKNIKKLMKIK